MCMRYKLRGNFPTDPEIALETILEARGVEDVYNFCSPSFACEHTPYDLNNIEPGVELLLKHIKAKSRILFVVDQDTDGFTSSSILWLYIKQIAPNANLDFIIHEHKQHGLNDVIIRIENNPNYDLVIVPDAGSYDVKEHQRLNELGIDCLVIDHHEQLYDDNGNPVISQAPNTIIINNQLSPNYPNKSLCGAGVVYKFCEVLDDTLELVEPLAPSFMDLVALGEIADVMDRTNPETNYFMMNGLRHIENKGFQALVEFQSYSLKDKAVYPYEGITPIDIAFYIAPLINAITRVGTMAEKEAMFYCFVDPTKPLQSTKRGAKIGETETAAEQTARVGKNAKARQDKLKDKAIEIIDFKIQKNDLLSNNIIVVEIDEEDNIPQELTGLVAMAIVSKYHKPCIIGRRNDLNKVQGSIRSDSNFNGLPSFKAFLEQSSLIDYAAGHDNACGFGISGGKIDQLIDYANTNLHAEDFENCYLVDYILDANDDNYDLLGVLASHPEYFGNHIDEIKFVVENIPLSTFQLMGANKDSTKISYNGIDYVRFRDTDFAAEIIEDRTRLLNVYGRANLNSWGGRTMVQMFIDDYEFKENSHKYDF